MTIILTLRKTIPSNSHNAPFSFELGEHWPAGQRFLFSPRDSEQDRLRNYYHIKASSLIVEQEGGEEVPVAIPKAQFPELFGIEVLP